jgi:hypothetical protein
MRLTTRRRYIRHATDLQTRSSGGGPGEERSLELWQDLLAEASNLVDQTGQARRLMERRRR